MPHIKLLRSTTTGNAPSALVSGEVAINETDRKLFNRDSGGNVRFTPLAPSAGVYSITWAASCTFDAQFGATQVARVTATAATTLTAPTNAVDGQKVIIEFLSSGGSFLLTLSTGSSGQFAFGSDITALTATASGKTDRIGVIYNATAARWLVIAVVKGY